MKVKNMTRRDAIPFLKKVRKATSGKKKRHALKIAIRVLESAVRSDQAGLSISKTA